MRPITIWLVIGLFAALLVQSVITASATDLTEREQELEQVRKRLRDLQSSVQKDRLRAGAANNRLRETEKAIGELTLQLAELDKQLTAKKQHLEKLQTNYNNERRRMEKLQDTLRVHIRSAYAMSRQGQLKLLLSQEEPATVSRLVTYFRFLSQARAEGIQHASRQLRVLEELKYEIVQQTQSLESLRLQRLQDSENLKKQGSKRREALAALNKEIERKGDEMGQLAKDEERLQDLLEELHKALAASKERATEHTSFAKRRGQLQWPVAGHLVTRYGQNRNVGDLKWRGVLISAPEGSEVGAVSQGRVVFADWLRGFGLLIILDHGDDYMSLYGYNQSLYKEVGDWVSVGEPISSVGMSGGQQTPGLYFELRRKGRPISPMDWFQGPPGKLQASQ